MQLRKAKLTDLDTLKSFEQEIIRYERPFAPNLAADPITYYDLAELIQREDAEVVVAEIEGEIVGSGYALIKDSKQYHRHDKHAYLGFMYVPPEFRGRGINGKIVDYLIAWSKVRKLTEIQLEVYAENASAVRAYEKRNFTPDLLRMVLNIEE